MTNPNRSAALQLVSIEALAPLALKQKGVSMHTAPRYPKLNLAIWVILTLLFFLSPLAVWSLH